jgi:mono/diheme cytochrome c family protein
LYKAACFAAIGFQLTTGSFPGGWIMRGAMLAAFACALALPIGVRAQAPSAAAKSAGRYYSEAQARRGKDLYTEDCAKCHGATLKGVATAPALIGDDFLHDYYAVNDLYNKISVTMPDDNVHGLTTETYLNIVAYLLQANGLPAGTENLKEDVAAMRRMPLLEKKSMKSASGSPYGFYTEEQAELGEGYFRGSCSMCHAFDPSKPDSRELPAPAGRGFGRDPSRIRLNLASTEVRDKYQNVGSLYNKIRTSMPLYGGGALSPEAYLDVAAYFLRENGYPAGKEPMSSDPEALMGMTLPEAGFTSLFNGKDFSGLRFLIGGNCTPRPEGCGQTEPGSTFKVENGMIVVSGTPLGFMYPDKKYKDFTLRLEYRFPPYPGMENSDQYYGNSGYLLFMQSLRVWPEMIEIQGMNAELLDVRANKSVKYTVDTLARARGTRPVGQWNSIEIVSKDSQVWSYVNGVLVSTITHHDYKDPGYLGFQSEGAKLYWRNIRIKEE